MYLYSDMALGIYNSIHPLYLLLLTVNFPVLSRLSLSLSLSLDIDIYNMYVELFPFWSFNFLISLTSFLYTQTCTPVHIRWRGYPISRSSWSRRGENKGKIVDWGEVDERRKQDWEEMINGREGLAFAGLVVEGGSRLAGWLQGGGIRLKDLLRRWDKGTLRNFLQKEMVGLLEVWWIYLKALNDIWTTTPPFPKWWACTLDTQN